MQLLVGEVSLFGFGQPGQLDAVGGVGGQVFGLDRELQHRTDELVGLAHPGCGQPLAVKSEPTRAPTGR